MSKLKPVDTTDGEDGPRVYVVMPEDDLRDETAPEIEIVTDEAGETMMRPRISIPPFGPLPPFPGSWINE